MQVILLEKIQNVGELGQLVTVKAGFGRNYLIPQGKAVPATKENVEAVEQRRAELEAAAAEQLAQAEERKAKLDELVVTIAAKAGDEGKLFGSIGNRDIADALTAEGVEVVKSEVRMPLGPIRQAGEYELDVQLHTDVAATIKVIVVPEA